jgi:hypothetical protein
VAFWQKGNRLVMTGLPKACPDKTAGVAVIKMEFAGTPKQELGCGCVLL